MQKAFEEKHSLYVQIFFLAHGIHLVHDKQILMDNTDSFSRVLSVMFLTSFIKKDIICVQI